MLSGVLPLCVLACGSVHSWATFPTTVRGAKTDLKAFVWIIQKPFGLCVRTQGKPGSPVMEKGRRWDVAGVAMVEEEGGISRGQEGPEYWVSREEPGLGDEEHGLVSPNVPRACPAGGVATERTKGKWNAPSTDPGTRTPESWLKRTGVSSHKDTNPIGSGPHSRLHLI